jgi:hypothetical protein
MPSGVTYILVCFCSLRYHFNACISSISVCSCVLFAVIVGVSVLFLMACFGRPSVFCGAAGLSFPCPGVFAIRSKACAACN